MKICIYYAGYNHHASKSYQKSFEKLLFPPFQNIHNGRLDQSCKQACVALFSFSHTGLPSFFFFHTLFPSSYLSYFLVYSNVLGSLLLLFNLKMDKRRKSQCMAVIGHIHLPFGVYTVKSRVSRLVENKALISLENVTLHLIGN